MRIIVRPVATTALNWAGLFFLALALLTLPISISTRYAATSASWWERGFARYDAVGRSGLSLDEVLRVAAETREYLANDDQRLNVAVSGASFYSEREILHMVDVKRLMSRQYDAGWAALGYLLFYIAAVALLFRRRLWRTLARATLYACGVIGVLVLILGLVALIDFDTAFRQFHLVFFTNDLWQLSSSDGLIQLFPQRFFFDTTLLIGGVTLGTLAAASGASALYLRRTRAIPAAHARQSG